ncbi:GntR family transcriptional regulator [Spirosoma endbachense]|uniref:GntR family transcriptional regulator n=1 Tax=Spirosoma endbachense TaxID=2666025 RepID=A0A6P1W0N1_9BACT|nr:GntR family transcriptional regulator [Spirosoma endbachense]QHV97852.1 GntR family transcriptional regulator [Spirosoma endbachense]
MQNNLIDQSADQPKYQQLIETVLLNIEQGTLELGQQLPSISEWASMQGVAKVTVAKAYEDLRQRGVVRSQHGKGFYVASTSVRTSLNILVIFDTLNAYKETLYDALKAALPDDATLSVFFHHYNPAVFETLIRNNLGRFSAYVLMPHFDTDVSDIVALIPPEKLLLLDQNLPNLSGDFSAVYQDFEQDIYSSLSSAFERLKHYQRITLVLSKDRFQYVPASLLAGFERFGEEFNFPTRIVNTYSGKLIEPGEAFLLFADRDLVDFLKEIARLDLPLGQQVGLLSYDDTPMKEILAGGISVISTDFALMGQTAGQLLATRRREKIANQGGLTLRNSL